MLKQNPEIKREAIQKNSKELSKRFIFQIKTKKIYYRGLKVL